MSKLIQAIREKQWKEVSNTLDEIENVDGDGWTALHWACYANVPFHIFKTIFDAFPDAAKKANKHGGTPLHLSVCYDDEKERFIKILIEYAPEIVFFRNNFNFSPLELALKHCRASCIIQALIQASPSSVSSPTEKECHIEMFFLTWYATVKRFLENKPEYYSTQDILESIGHGGWFNLKYIYDVSHILLKGCTSDEKKDNFLLLLASFQSIYCPWVFFELFIYINPDEISSFPPRLIFDPPKKVTTYDKLFSCSECEHNSKIIFESGSDLFCSSCLGDYYNSYAIHRNDDLEQIQSIFILITEFPSILNNISWFLRK